MATNLNVGQKLSAKIYTLDGNQVAINTLHYDVTAVGGTPATDQDFSDQLDAALAASFKALLNNGAAYRGLLCQIIAPLPVIVAVQTTSSAGIGTAGVTALPKQCSGIISYYTALAGRANRGRVFIPFPASSDDTGDGVPIAGYVTRLNTLNAAIRSFSAIATGGRTATVVFGIYHRSSRTITPVISSVNQPKWATQRKRGSYGRANSTPI